MSDDHFELLFVCHANLCRSPMAERLARLAFDRHLGDESKRLTISSAGVSAFRGGSMHPYAAQALADVGADPGGFASRPITAQMPTQANLILTATRDQRAYCVALDPTALPRTFTIRQFGRLATRLAAMSPPTQGPVVTRLHAILSQVALARAQVQPSPPEGDDLADPVAGPLDAFRQCARDIQSALDQMLKFL